MNYNASKGISVGDYDMNYLKYEYERHARAFLRYNSLIDSNDKDVLVACAINTSSKIKGVPTADYQAAMRRYDKYLNSSYE